MELNWHLIHFIRTWAIVRITLLQENLGQGMRERNWIYSWRKYKHSAGCSQIAGHASLLKWEKKRTKLPKKPILRGEKQQPHQGVNWLWLNLPRVTCKETCGRWMLPKANWSFQIEEKPTQGHFVPCSLSKVFSLRQRYFWSFIKDWLANGTSVSQTQFFLKKISPSNKGY